MIRIALDLELEQPNTNIQTPDSQLSEERIIQVGYVIFNDATGEFLKEVCREVNIGVPLSSFIKSLTGIKDDMIKRGSPLIEIIAELQENRSSFGASRKLLTWGGGDQEAILRELPKDFSWEFARSAFNVKHLFQFFQELSGSNPSGGLKKSLSRLGIKFDGIAHNALSDAKNTATIFLKLKENFKRGIDNVKL